MGTLRKYLEDKGFELDSYYNDNKTFTRKVEIGSYPSDMVYVQIFDEGNMLLSVRYEQTWDRKKVTLATIDSVEKLDMFLNSILPE